MIPADQISCIKTISGEFLLPFKVSGLIYFAVPTKVFYVIAFYLSSKTFLAEPKSPIFI